MKLCLAVFFFALGTSALRLFLTRTDLICQLSAPLFLPNIFSWALAMGAVVVLMMIWYLVAAWYQEKQQAGVLKF